MSTNRSTDTHMSIDAFVNGLRLAILADRVDTNRRVGTARDHAATIGGVRQNSRPGGICMDSIGVSESGAVHTVNNVPATYALADP